MKVRFIGYLILIDFGSVHEDVFCFSKDLSIIKLF